MPITTTPFDPIEDQLLDHRAHLAALKDERNRERRTDPGPLGRRDRATFLKAIGRRIDEERATVLRLAEELEAQHAGAEAQAQGSEEPFHLLTFLTSYEEGALTEDEVAEGFQHLIDSRLVWSLQGHYGRRAIGLIEAGLCQLPEDAS